MAVRTIRAMLAPPVSTAASARAVRGRVSFSGLVSLTAVAAVLLVVSVPRLRGIALQENEIDARTTAQLLAQALAELPDGSPPRIADLLRRPGLAGTRADAALLKDGKLLRRHGYLFEITRLLPSVAFTCAPLALPSGAATDLGFLLAVRAWPWKRGSTGCSAFLVTAAGGMLVHAADGEPWQGTKAAGLPFEGGPGWTPTR